jgi:NAD(P)-dependent dehydrogenase (short-subunit alcohol dehydrogenase family)
MNGEAPVAVVTGSHGGIGRAVALTLSDAGLRVVGIDRNIDGAVAGLDHAIAIDITDPSACVAALIEVEGRYGRLDGLVNNAGVNLWQNFADWNDADARAVFEINVWGSINMTRAAYPMLAAAQSAAVVFTTSTAGTMGVAGTCAYGMTKAALESSARTLAIEWAQIPIRVNAVSATIVPTQMNAAIRRSSEYTEHKLASIPIRRMVSTAEVAHAISFLLSPGAAAITGTTLQIDGGVTVSG